MTVTMKRVEWQVKLSKGNLSSVYGTYPSKEEAEEIADAHRSTGYWTVEVVEARRDMTDAEVTEAFRYLKG